MIIKIEICEHFYLFLFRHRIATYFYKSYLGARQCPRQVEQLKAARSYHPFLEAIQAIFDPQ